MRIARAIVRGAVIGAATWTAMLAFRRALIAAPGWGTHDPDRPRRLNNLALARLKRGQDESAEALLYTAHELLELADPKRLELIRTVRANIAALYTLQASRERHAHRDDPARTLLTTAVEVLEESGPGAARMLVRALTNLARLERAQGNRDKSAALLERAAALGDQLRAASPGETAEDLLAVADVYHLLGQPREADARLERAAAILHHASGRARARLGTCLSRRAALAHEAGRLVDAGSLYRHALQVKLAALGPRHPSVACTLEGHAALLRALDRREEASLLEARARPVRARTGRRDPLRHVEPLDTFRIQAGPRPT
jgi:tetratricopeptide (TPR) repeat protein